MKRINPEKRHLIVAMSYDYEEIGVEEKERYFMVAFGDANTYNPNQGNKMLQEINPSHIIYGMCLMVDDFFSKVIITPFCYQSFFLKGHKTLLYDSESLLLPNMISDPRPLLQDFRRDDKYIY